MWAQMISMRIKPGRDAEMTALVEQLRAAEQPDSGLIREITMRDQNELNHYYMLVMFESEEHARARESDPRRAELLSGLRDTMMEISDGDRGFVDLEVLGETSH